MSLFIFVLGMFLHAIGSWTLGYWAGATTAFKVTTGNPAKLGESHRLAAWVLQVIGIAILIQFYFNFVFDK